MLFTDRHEAEHFRGRHLCGLPDCRGELVTAWDGGENRYRVHCGVCKSGKLKPRRSLTARWLAGEVNVDIATANKLEAKLGATPLDSKALMVLETPGMLDRLDRGARRLGLALTPDQKLELGRFCQDYGIDPYMGEITIYENRPYVTVNCYRRKANEHRRYLSHFTEVVTDAAMKGALGYDAGDVVAKCELWLRGAPKPVVAYGRANATRPHRVKADGTGGNPVERADPWVMASKRAEMRAIRAGIGLNLPGIEIDAGEDEDVIEGEARIVEVDGQQVDVQTGEIVDAGPGLGDEEPDEPPRCEMDQMPLDELAKTYVADKPNREKLILKWLWSRGVATVLDASEADRIALRAELIRRIALRPVRWQS